MPLFRPILAATLILGAVVSQPAQAGIRIGSMVCDNRVMVTQLHSAPSTRPGGSWTDYFVTLQTTWPLLTVSVYYGSNFGGSTNGPFNIGSFARSSSVTVKYLTVPPPPFPGALPTTDGLDIICTAP